MKLNLEQLKNIASAATPGEYSGRTEDYYDGTDLTYRELIGPKINSNAPSTSDLGKRADADLDYFVTFTPTVAIALIERIEKLDGALESIVINDGHDDHPEIARKALGDS